MNMRSRRAAFTLVELVVGAGLMSLIALGSAYVVSSSIRTFETTSNQLTADQSASTALGIVSRDLQEAKQFVINSPTSMTVYYPVTNPDGTYDRNLVDNVNTITYYQGNPDLSANPTGTCLIRSPATARPRAICKDVSMLDFTSISASSVDVTLEATMSDYNLPRRCYMIHRAIFLRNY